VYILNATSQDIRKLKLGRKWVFQLGLPNTSKVLAQWLKDNKVKVLEWPSQSPELNPIEYLWTGLKKPVNKEAYKPDSVTPSLSGVMGQNSPNPYEKLVEGYPKRLTQVKQFQGNATKY
jgi:hypothetical protein